MRPMHVSQLQCHQGIMQRPHAHHVSTLPHRAANNAFVKRSSELKKLFEPLHDAWERVTRVLVAALDR